MLLWWLRLVESRILVVLVVWVCSSEQLAKRVSYFSISNILNKHQAYGLE